MRIHSTEDLLAVIPFLLGFRPDNSLVLLVVDESTGSIVTAARLDLPVNDEPVDGFRAVLDRTIATLATRSSAGVVLAGYGPADRVEPAVATAIDAAHAAGVPVHDALRVTDGRFWRLPHAERLTEPATVTGPAASTNPGIAGAPDGMPFDPAGSSAAAAAVYAGLVALPDRDALAATLAPDPAAHDRMVLATRAACAYLTDLLDNARTDGDDQAGDPGDDPDAVLQTPTGEALAAAARLYLTDIQDTYRHGHPISDTRAAMLTVLLALPSLWDFAAQRTNRDEWQITMWRDLVRRAQPPFTAQAATLLALCGLHAGDGVLANMAIDRALDADPDHRLAHLLRQAIAAGIDPETVTALLNG
jgi:hypothetical protein